MMSKKFPSQGGLTLVELLVSIVLMLLVSIATVALFSVSSSSYKTVDASQELQDNARFAMYVIGEAARSAGFQDRTGPIQPGNPNLTDVVFGPTKVSTWRVQGANGAVINTLADLKKVAPDDASTAFSTSGVTQNSDALVLRFFGASDTVTPANPDNTMRDCSGRPIPYPTAEWDVGLSAFHVRTVNGEPELVCVSYNPNGSVVSSTQIIRGVETFQVMYGLDTDGDDVPDRWLSASSAWTPFAANPNWNNVVAIRVGMVLRGPVGSAQGRSTTASDNDYYPLGKDFTGTSTETGLKFPAPDDGRLRRAFATTFMLRKSVR